MTKQFQQIMVASLFLMTDSIPIKGIIHRRGSCINGQNDNAALNKTFIQGFMEESTEETSERILSKKRVLEGSHRNVLEATKAELAMAKEELKRAKESAMQSWLDSKPLIDELDMQKSNLAKAQQSSTTSKTVIAKLESQLETIHKSIKSKREDQFKTESMIRDVNHALDQTCNELERLKLDRNKEKQMQTKLRQILHLRRQKVHALQLTLQAVLLESYAVKESTAKALEQINHSETRTAVVQLTHEDYYCLARKAKEKISKANWRVSVSMEQKLAAEASHELALSRLNRYHSSRSWSTNGRNKIGQRYKERDAKDQDAIVEWEVTTNRTKTLTKSEGVKLQESRRSGRNIKISKKKSTIMYKMKKCLLQKLKKLSG